MRVRMPLLAASAAAWLTLVVRPHEAAVCTMPSMRWTPASPAKQRCLNRCHAHTELAAFGVKADLDVLRFGFIHAWWCIGACSGLMLLPMLFPGRHLAAMFAITLWLAGERIEKPRSSAWRWRGPGSV